MCSNFQMIKFMKIAACQAFQKNIYKNGIQTSKILCCDQRDMKIHFHNFEIFINYAIQKLLRTVYTCGIYS